MALTPKPLPGYWCGDIRPDGGYVVAAWQGMHVRTDAGAMQCPDVPNWPRITRTGPVRIAYQGSGFTRLMDVGPGADWQALPEACGAHGPVIFDNAGVLHRSDCSRGSEGYHHVAPDGRLVWGNEASTRVGSELRESTDLGDGIIVGQGNWGGLWAQLPDGYRQIRSGAAMCVRATRDGDRLGICWYAPDVPHRGSATAYLLWCTVAELRALPTLATSRPATTYMPIVNVDREALCGWFTGWDAPDRFDASLPGNCYLHVVKGDDVPWLELKDPAGRVLARYVSGVPDGDRASLEARARAAAGPVPVIGYATRQMIASRGVPDVDIVGFEAYQLADETDEAFLARLESYGKSGRLGVLLAQGYSSNTVLTADLRRVVGPVSAVLRRYPNIRGAIGFSGLSRATNITEHPAALADWRRVFASVTGRPSLEVPRPVPPPAPVPTPEPPAPPPPPAVGPEPPVEPEPWSEPERPRHYLAVNDVLYPGDRLVSEDGTVALHFQPDGNLVLRRTSDDVDLWDARTADRGGVELWMQDDGNLVMYGKYDVLDWDATVPLPVVWNTGTAGHPGAIAIVRGGDHRDVVVAVEPDVIWRGARPSAQPRPTPQRPASGGFSVLGWLIGLFTRRKS